MRAIVPWIVAAIVGSSSSPLAGEYVYPGDRQWIYCAETAEACFLYCRTHFDCPRPDTMFVFIRANDPIGVVRAHFRLEVDYPCCDSILAVVPCPGVAIENGDLLQGMTISFPVLTSGHFKALTLVIWKDSQDSHPALWEYGYCIRDACLERSNAETVPLLDYCTRPFYPDCYWTSVLWYHPDTVDVSIGARTDVKVQWEVNHSGYGGSYVSVADEQNWVHDHTPGSIWITGCLTCLWHIQTSHIYTEVPGDVPEGSLSTLTITAFNGTVQERFVLRAVTPIGTEKQSWGTLKDLFK